MKLNEGTIRYKSGYPIIKKNGTWQMLRHVRWIEAGNRIEEGMFLVAINGDKDDCRPENTKMIAKGEWLAQARGQCVIKTQEEREQRKREYYREYHRVHYDGKKRKQGYPYKYQILNEEQKYFIRENYSTMTNNEIMKHLGISRTKLINEAFYIGVRKDKEAIRAKRSVNKNKPKQVKRKSTYKLWTQEECDLFIKLYPVTENTQLADKFGCSTRNVLNKAKYLGLKKDKAIKLISPKMREQMQRRQEAKDAKDKAKIEAKKIKEAIKLAKLAQSGIRKRFEEKKLPSLARDYSQMRAVRVTEKTYIYIKAGECEEKAKEQYFKTRKIAV